MSIRMNDTITAISGIQVGHASNDEALTGCTVVICPSGTVGAVDVRGGAPGTRETDLLNPHNAVNRVDAIVLSGGSAYGLAATDGVMKYMEDSGQGYPTASGIVVPIVPSAILYDLHLGKPGIRPDASMGFSACVSASSDPVIEGNVGAGTGCLIGAFQGAELATKGGIGSYCISLGDGVQVAALIAVNAVGDVIAEDGEILAGLRSSSDAPGFVGMLNLLGSMALETEQKETRENTVIGVVATNVTLTKSQLQRVAQMAHDGLARAIRPAHTPFDGDTIFAIATGELGQGSPATIGAFAAEAVEHAIRRGVRKAVSIGGARAWNL